MGSAKKPITRKEVIDALRRIRFGGFDTDVKLILSYIDSLEAKTKQTVDPRDIQERAKLLAQKMGIEFAKVIGETLPKKPPEKPEEKKRRRRGGRGKGKKKATFGIGRGYK